MHWSISPPDATRRPAIEARIRGKLKPPGALGQLEALATQLALALEQDDRIVLDPVQLLLFAADHGVAAEGVSVAPAAVTRVMTTQFLAGRAAVNCFARSVGVPMEVIDAGLLEPLSIDSTASEASAPRYVEQPSGRGTANLALEPAMSSAQAAHCLDRGAALVRRHVARGIRVFLLGEMGIGNTTAAAALMAALTGLEVPECVGRGTGIDDQQFARKQALVAQALRRLSPAMRQDPMRLLAELGGFEIGQMAGAILAAAEARRLVIIDGFIASAAALLALRMAPPCRDWLVFAHQSGEQGHARLLAACQARPLLQLDLRLGEGTGAVLALPLLRAAAAFYNEMASFDDLGLSLPGL